MRCRVEADESISLMCQRRTPWVHDYCYQLVLIKVRDDMSTNCVSYLIQLNARTKSQNGNVRYFGQSCRRHAEFLEACSPAALFHGLVSPVLIGCSPALLAPTPGDSEVTIRRQLRLEYHVAIQLGIDAVCTWIALNLAGTFGGKGRRLLSHLTLRG